MTLLKGGVRFVFNRCQGVVDGFGVFQGSQNMRLNNIIPE
jgi:hypothetical protein